MSDWKSRAKKVDDWKLRATPVEEANIPIVDERTPYVSVKDRAIAKNFAQSAEKQAAFIKQKYPDLEVKLQGSNVAIRKPNDPEFKVLDPSALELEDFSDLGDTVASAGLSTVGAIGGGALGALAGPAGVVAGGMAGSGAAGAGSEALRQRLGKALGIPQDVDMGDVATAGALNAAGVGLFGQPATKAATGFVQNAKGLSQEAAEQLVDNAGLLRTAWNKGLPKATNMWFGTTDDVLQSYVDPASREAVDRLAEGSKTEFTESLVDRIRSALNTEKRSVGEKLASEIDKAGSINLSSAKQALQAAVDKAQAEFDAFPNALNKAKLDDAMATYDQIFRSVNSPKIGPAAQIPDEIKASQAWKLQGDLKDFADLRRIGGGVNSRFSSSATQGEKDLAESALGSYRAIGNELAKATEGASPALKKQYGEIMDVQNTISPYLRTDQSAYTSFKNSDQSSKIAFKEALERLEKKTGEKFRDDIVKLQAADYFGSGAWTPKSIGGVTSTSRSAPATALGIILGTNLGYSMGGPGAATLGAAIGAAGGNALASPSMLKNIIRASDPIRSGANAISPYLVPTMPILREINNSSWRDVE